MAAARGDGRELREQVRRAASEREHGHASDRRRQAQALAQELRDSDARLLRRA